MLHKTNGIVLRSIKYGDSSLITTIFTAVYGIQTYIVQGVRSTKAKQNRAGFFQPGMLLDLVVYQQPQKSMQRIREFSATYIYTGLQENVVKNSISIFSVELLLRLLPEQAPLPALYDMACEYFIALDKLSIHQVANFPLFFIIQCSKILGYDLKGNFPGEKTMNIMPEAGFAANSSSAMPFINNEDTGILNLLLIADNYNVLEKIEMNADIRLRLIDWFIAYLQLHTQHMGNLRSLSVLRAILH